MLEYHARNVRYIEIEARDATRGQKIDHLDHIILMRIKSILVWLRYGNIAMSKFKVECTIFIVDFCFRALVYEVGIIE